MHSLPGDLRYRRPILSSFFASITSRIDEQPVFQMPEASGKHSALRGFTSGFNPVATAVQELQ
jgi:hypothetical protein